MIKHKKLKEDQKAVYAEEAGGQAPNQKEKISLVVDLHELLLYICFEAFEIILILLFL